MTFREKGHVFSHPDAVGAVRRRRHGLSYPGPGRRLTLPSPSTSLRTPQPTVFSSTFGAARSSGRRHQGNDLMAPKLTHVYAAAAGIVTRDRHPRQRRQVHRDPAPGGLVDPLPASQQRRSGDGQRSGRLVMTLVPGLEVGSHVEAGQHIGYVGDSGNAEWTGSHTHFELAHEGAGSRSLSDPQGRLRAGHGVACSHGPLGAMTIRRRQAVLTSPSPTGGNARRRGPLPRQPGPGGRGKPFAPPSPARAVARRRGPRSHG